jgi:pimeloyl-ACP methyl ester carboxylesterase
MDSSLWDGVLPAFGDRTVVTVDGPGHGRSDDPPSRWTLDQHTEALREVMDHHGLDRAVLVGHSWGGMVSLRLSLAHPDRVAGLGLVNTPLTRTAGLSRAGFRAQQALLLATGATRFYSRRAAGSMYDTASLRRRPALAAEMAHRLRSRRGRTLSQTLSAVILQPADMLDELRHVTVPTSVVAGATDYVLPPVVQRAVAEALPEAVVTLVAGGHVSPQEDPDATVTALHDLLRRADRTSVRPPA